MKKMIFALMVLAIIPLSAQAQRGGMGDWSVSFAGGANIAAMDSKMVLWDSTDDSGVFEDYSGYGGVESHVAIRVGRIETSYILQYFFSKKDGDTTIGGTEKAEVGDIDFYHELIDISYYIIDEPILTGFTFSVGIGKGTTTIEVERTLGGVEQDKVENYFKTLHMHGSVHYEILDWLFGKLTYRSLTMNNVSQPSFTSSSYSLTGGVKF
ncbi:MAG: hypothetical protein GY866_05435 [Proteobacteria bacterium]|nr:hypothetical protein [Pseudomonadota bacterium]